MRPTAYCLLPIALDEEERVEEECFTVLCRPGDDLLSHVLRQSTIGAKAFDGRVRDGIGSDRLARATRPAKDGFGSKGGVGSRRQAVGQSDCRLPIADWSFRVCCFRDRFCVRSLLSRLGDESNQVERAISTGQLHALPRFHIRPINVVVFHGSSGRTGFEAGFPLRCLQRLSIPYIATLHCGWRHNRSTRDTFTPVLSY